MARGTRLDHATHRALAALGLAAWLAAPVARAAPPQPVQADSGGDYYELVARFDSGHLLFAVAGLGNLGWGDDNATVVGFVVDPDGSAHRFSRSEHDAEQRLSPDGLRMDLRSIVFDRSTRPWQFRVDKGEFKLDLAIRAGAAARARPAVQPAPRCPFDVLESATPVSGTLWRSGMPAPLAIAGRIAVTHRATRGLEADCQLRRVEFFALDGALGLYFTEITGADGRASRWLVATRSGRTVYEGAPDSAELAWRPGPDGYPQPASLRFAAPGLGGRVEIDAPVVVYDPTERMPAPLRWAVSLRTRPRLTASASRFELAPAGEPRIAGRGVTRVTYSNPLAQDRHDSQLAIGGQ